MVGILLVTFILKLIDDNIKVIVEPMRALAADTVNANGINPNPVMRTK